MASCVYFRLRTVIESNPDLFDPLQVSFGPCVDQAEKKNPNENKYFDECEQSLPVFNPAPEYRRHRKDKSNLNFKYDENQRYDVEPNVEVDPRAAHRRLTAYISRKFADLRVRRPEQFSDQQVNAHKAQT